MWRVSLLQPTTCGRRVVRRVRPRQPVNWIRRSICTGAFPTTSGKPATARRSARPWPNAISSNWRGVRIEAVRRLDPKHAAVLPAISQIQGKLAATTGQEREKRDDSAARIELLRTIPGGPPLASFVVNLALRRRFRKRG